MPEGKKSERIPADPITLGVSHSGKWHKDTCEKWTVASAQSPWKKKLFIDDDDECFEEDIAPTLSTSKMNGFDKLSCEWTLMTLLDASAVPRFRRHPTRKMRKGGLQLVLHEATHSVETMKFPLQGCLVE